MTHSAPKVYHNIRFEYKVAPHDRIQVTVYNHPELSTETANSTRGVLVDGNGNVMLPLVNTVHLAGLTQPQAAHKLQIAYSHYLKRSAVALEVVNKKAFVKGEVSAQGPIT